MTTLGGDRQLALVVGLVDRMQEAGSWTGETHVQKCMYFLKQVAGVPVEYNYVLHKHGPYSFELHEDVLSMLIAQVLDVQRRPPYGSSFRVGRFGRRLMDRFPKTLGAHDAPLGFVAEKLSEKGVVELERLATAAYVSAKHTDWTVSKRAKEVRRLKPNISASAAKDAVRETDELMAEARGRLS